jgi:hypothetical protein
MPQSHKATGILSLHRLLHCPKCSPRPLFYLTSRLAWPPAIWSASLNMLAGFVPQVPLFQRFRGMWNLCLSPQSTLPTKARCTEGELDTHSVCQLELLYMSTPEVFPNEHPAPQKSLKASDFQTVDSGLGLDSRLSTQCLPCRDR